MFHARGTDRDATETTESETSGDSFPEAAPDARLRLIYLPTSATTQHEIRETLGKGQECETGLVL